MKTTRFHRFEGKLDAHTTPLRAYFKENPLQHKYGIETLTDIRVSLTKARAFLKNAIYIAKTGMISTLTPYR
ncbi:MAG: hypothetical protein PHR16_12925 [Methylovulum sp.]|nr:hypothetical protein [Methylovulum sp.]